MSVSTRQVRALALLTVVGLLALSAAFWATPARGQEEPEVIAELGFGAGLSGDNEVPPLDSAASGSFLIDVDTENQTATWSFWLANVQDITKLHVHFAPAGENGDLVTVLFASDPTVSSPTSVRLEGQFDVSALLAALADDWDGFIAALEGGNLYVNVHSVANPGGELRGQILLGDGAAPTIGIAVSAGSSLFGWFGADVTSTYLLDEYDAIVAIWFLDAEGWILDSRDLPGFLRISIFIDLGTGILIIASDDFVLEVPLA